MNKRIYGIPRELIQEVCTCGCLTFEIWYKWDVLYSKCMSCGKESLQTSNKSFGTINEDGTIGEGI